jgi:hypothetical protein
MGRTQTAFGQVEAGAAGASKAREPTTTFKRFPAGTELVPISRDRRTVGRLTSGLSSCADDAAEGVEVLTAGVLTAGVLAAGVETAGFLAACVPVAVVLTAGKVIAGVGTAAVLAARLVLVLELAEVEGMAGPPVADGAAAASVAADSLASSAVALSCVVITGAGTALAVLGAPSRAHTSVVEVTAAIQALVLRFATLVMFAAPWPAGP